MHSLSLQASLKYAIISVPPTRCSIHTETARNDHHDTSYKIMLVMAKEKNLMILQD